MKIVEFWGKGWHLVSSVHMSVDENPTDKGMLLMKVIKSIGPRLLPGRTIEHT